MRVDLHSHSTASDGQLSPIELLQRASMLGLDVFSITDHDTTAAYTQLASASPSLTLIPGIEFSTCWNKTEIHVLGLNVQLSNASLCEGVLTQQQARQQRAQLIADRLARIFDIDNPYEQVERLANNKNIGRVHFAQYMFNNKLVRSIEEAFKKYLRVGKPAHVKHLWTDYREIISWILAAGGVAVLAHPGKYNLTRTRLNSLIDDFYLAGGRAMEVISGRQVSTLTRDLARLCEQKNLFASCGSDFHKPGLSWSELGKFPPLPKNCRAIWEYW